MVKFEEFWSKELTTEQKSKLRVMYLDDKDILTDFDWLHYDEYLENSGTIGKSHQLVFYNNGCLWQLSYSFGGIDFTLECVYEPSEEKFKNSFELIKDLLLADTSLIVHIQFKENYHFIRVAYYMEEQK